MNTPNFENLIIPADILLNKDLSDREKILLSIILSLSRKGNICYAGNGYIAEIFNVATETISRTISSLKNKKYIKVILNNKTKNLRKREIVPIKENIFKYSQNKQSSINENSNKYVQNSQTGIITNDKYINSNYINNNKVNDVQNLYKTIQYANIDWSKYYDN